MNPDQTFGTTELSPVFQEASEIERQFKANKKDLSKEKSLLVTLRGPSAKHFWDGIERFGEQLGELGLDSQVDAGRLRR